MLGIKCSKYLPVGIHGCEGFNISAALVGAFRSALARAVWSEKLPMTNNLALLSLLNDPFSSGPGFIAIRWSRCRQMRRYLAHRPDEEGRIHRLLGYASTGSPDPIYILISSALEIGFSWDSEFRSAVFRLWRNGVAPYLCKRKGFRIELFGFDIATPQAVWLLTTSRRPLVRTKYILSPSGALTGTLRIFGTWLRMSLITQSSGLMAVWNSCHILMSKLQELGFSLVLLLLSSITMNGDMRRIQIGNLTVAHTFFASNPELLQTVQRAEYWEIALALQAFSGIHVGIDNLDVLGGVALLLGQGDEGVPLSFVTDGDLIAHHSLNVSVERAVDVTSPH